MGSKKPDKSKAPKTKPAAAKPAAAKSAAAKSALAKRAAMPRQSVFHPNFVKDWERHNAAGRLNMNDLRAVMSLLNDNQGPLPAQYKDHELKGAKWKGVRECHVHGDFLLAYIVEDGGKTVKYMAVGTHAELFE